MELIETILGTALGIAFIIFAIVPSKFSISKKIIKLVDIKSPLVTKSGMVRRKDRKGVTSCDSIIQENLK